VEVVRALPTRSRVGAGLVVPVAGRGQQLLAALLHVPGLVVLRDALRRPREEHGVGLEGELVMADVRRLQREGALQVGLGHGDVLAGQEIGRASCRERVEDAGVAGAVRVTSRTVYG